MTRPKCFPIRIAAGCAALALLALAGAARAQSDDDTRLRLNQDLSRKAAEREAKTLEEASPAVLVIDGQAYAVGPGADDVGKALYLSLARRQWPDARRFLKAYLALPERDPMLVRYAQGLLARQDGDLRAAERALRELLTLKPDFMPGRIELARVLFENQHDREALSAFQAILADLPTSEPSGAGVRRSVEGFVAALRQRGAWRGSLALGPGYNSNINQASGSYACLLPGPDGLCFFDRKTPDPLGAASVSFEAALNRRMPLRGSSGLSLRALAYGELYPEEGAYSQATLIAQAGFDYRTAGLALGVAPSLDIGTLGAQRLYDAPGVHIELSRAFGPSTLIKLEGDYKVLRYRQAAFAPLDGAQASLFLTALRGLKHGWTVFGGFDLADKDADQPVNAYRQAGLRLGAVTPTFAGLNANVFASVRRKRWDAVNETLEARRRDDEQAVTAIVRAPRLKMVGLTPSLTVQYAKVASSIDWLFSYEKVAASLKLERVF
ncbi:cytochrome c biogenesis factor [Caulobacter sp. AP07]|uniref:surface lipoprotein assembly modifier n=1 Tax=Caulobacter sp. AP07 TaxID=1144304 RepID=UPI000271E32C|nr:surface lipoprotein assembly modifier [Caulobacter sp. AP07]EJL38457.1 cytochrome c biogenesis factor [Caulobacter sp. AP07]